ncbi:MAG: hypothetical protein K6356_06710 [Chloroflexus sp.]
MEQRRTNWPAWLALGIALVALLVALGSLMMSQRAIRTVQTMPRWSDQPVTPSTPPGWQQRRERGQVVPPGWQQWGEPGQVVPPGWQQWGERGQIVPPGWQHHGMPGMMNERGWFSSLLGLLDNLLKLAALVLLIWLGIHIFRQRQNPPAAPPPPPLTPAGHDPRVE